MDKKTTMTTNEYLSGVIHNQKLEMSKEKKNEQPQFHNDINKDHSILEITD